MSSAELIGALITALGLGWVLGRGIKAIRQFLDLI